MSETKSATLNDLSETYLAPLYWKALELLCLDAMIKDEKAVALVTQMGFDFSGVGQIKMIELLQAMRIIFTCEMDRYIRDFLNHHLEAGSVLTLRDHFSGSELVSDGWKPFEVWLGNHYLSNSLYSGLMQWGLWSGKEPEDWGDPATLFRTGGIRLLNERGFFDQPEPRLVAYRWMARGDSGVEVIMFYRKNSR